MLKINDLKIKSEEKILIDGFNLNIEKGKIHVIMGPNGAGKSTFSKVVSGHPKYEVVSGSIFYEGKDLLQIPVEERARNGVFVSFQYPIEISGISNFEFLHACYNSRKDISEKLTKKEFESLLLEKMESLKIKPEFMKRNINEGFSGGEKKKNEILQMELFNPTLTILDEIDSGLDVDALRLITKRIMELKKKNPESSLVLITHYQRLLNYIKPDFVHVLVNGKIVKEGTEELALEIEQKGYDYLTGAANV